MSKSGVALRCMGFIQSGTGSKKNQPSEGEGEKP